MTTDAQIQGSHRPAMRPTITARAVGGVIACTLASVPLAIGFSLWGFYVDRADREWAAGYVLVSIVFVTFFALVIATFCAVCVGIPIYALTSRLRQWRTLALLLAAIAVAVVFHETWHGGHIFEDPESTVTFAFFGLYSGAAFWFGADVWQPVR